MHTSTPTSSLKLQLQHKISQKRHAVEDSYGKKSSSIKQGNYLVPSLLYPQSVAADQVPEYLYERAIDAIEELGKTHPWWEIHQKMILSTFTLFTKGPLIDRGSLSASESSKVSEEVSLLLKALIPILNGIDLSSLSSKNPLHILEFLCRRIRIHEFEANELIFMSLMYHEAPIFKLLVSLVKFTKFTEWSFLCYYLESNSVISRDHLVTNLIMNNGFLLGKFHTFIRSIVNSGFETDGLISLLDYRNLISFFSAIYYESILKISSDPKTNPLRLTILANLLKNMKNFRKDIFKDWYIAQLLLLIPLLYALDLTSSRQNEHNSQEFMAQFIVRQLIKYDLPSARPHILSLICCLCQLFYEQSRKSSIFMTIDIPTLEMLAQWQNIDSLLNSVISNLESTAFVNVVQNTLSSIPANVLQANASIKMIIPYFLGKNSNPF